MFHSRVHIEAGDMVILYVSRENTIAIHVSPGDFFHNKYGRYAHDDMIGMKYGSKMHSPPPHSGYVHLLRPTPELWTLSLPHRTQILYMPDIAYINSRLGIRPGTKVIEAGTGSGSMTHTLARGVGSSGVVRSYEYHRTRFEKAEQEFNDHGLHNVALEHRNVCKEGFGNAKDINAVFLDLPAPWEAIPHAINTFSSESISRICCFSPCLEQVLKTVVTLRSHGFHDISTQEVLVRNHELVYPPNTAPPPFRTVSSIVDKLQRHELKKEERRLIQMKTAREKARKSKESAAAQSAVAAEGRVASGDVVDATAEGSVSAGSPERKKRKTDEAGLDEADSTHGPVPITTTASSISTAEDVSDNIKNVIAQAAEVEEDMEEKQTPLARQEPSHELSQIVVTKPSAEMRGHTSYLTFACYYPSKVRISLDSQEEQKRPAAGNRLGTLAKAESNGREGSQDTEYGDDGMDAVLGTLTEEEIIGMGAK